MNKISKVNYFLIIAGFVLIPLMFAFGDTPPPGTVKAKVLDGSGNPIASSSGALNVNVTNPGGGTGTSNQGSPNGGGANAWWVQGSLGRTWSLLNTTDSVNVGNFPSSFNIGNFPATQPVSGSVSVSNFPSVFGATQSGTWSVGVNNFPSVQPVSATSLPLPANASVESGGHLASIDAKTPALVSGAVPVTGTIMTSPSAPTDATANGTMGSSGATVTVSASGIADGAINIVGAFVGSIQVQCVPYGGGSNNNLSTLQSGIWSTSAITSPGFYKFRGANGCQNVQSVYSAYTSGTPTVWLAANQAVGSPTVSQPNAANLNATVVQSTGTNLHTVVDSGSVTANQGGAPWSVSQSGLWTTGRTWSLLNTTDSVNVGNFPSSFQVSNFPSSQNVVVTSSSLPTNAAVESGGHLASIDTKLTAPLAVTGTISATNAANGPTGSAVPAQATQVAGSDGTNLRSLKVSSSGVLSVDGSGTTQPISGTVTANQGGAPWSVSGTVTANAGTGTFTVGQATGSNLHVVVDTAPTTAVTQSGTWTVQPGNTANTTPWLATINQGGNSATVTGSNALKVDGSAVTQPISAVSLPLPTGAATSAKQPALGTAGFASSDVLSVQGITSMTPLKVDGSGVTQPVSGTVAATQSGAWNIGNITGTVSLPIGASTSANQTTELGYLASIVTNTGVQATDQTTTGTISSLGGTVSITGQGVYTTTFSISGTWTATLVIEGQTPDSAWTQIPINIITSNLPYQQFPTITTNGTYSITGGGFTNIRVRASAYTSGTVNVAIDGSLAQQTVIANVTTPDLAITGASAQTATVNNIMTSTSGSAATFVGGFHSANIQIVSTGTGGTFIFEGSNDNVNFQTIPVYNQLILTGTPITAAITATASQLIYTFPITTNYVRLRIATAITGGSIQAFSKFSQTTWTPAVFQVAQATAANNNTTAVIASGTVTTVSSVTSVASDSLSVNTNVADRASAAATTTFTSGTIAPAAGQISYSVQVALTANSGTGQTMDCVVNESIDTGTTWFTVYSFPRFTTTNVTYQSPMMRFTGNRIQYVCTIAGTTPSFTFSINRVGSNVQSQQDRMFYDRSMVPTTASSSTGAWLAEGCTSSQVTYSQSAVTTNPTLTVQTSEDNANWANTSYTIVPTGAGTFTTMVPQMAAKYARLFVTNAGTGVTYTYSAFRCAGP